MSELGSGDSGVLPKDVEPVEWTDDERMGFLMSAFKERALNPHSYDNKLRFWKTLVASWCKHSRRPVVDEASLRRRFRRKETLPACLGPVLESLRGDGELMPYDEVWRGTYQVEGWGGWLRNKLVTSPTQKVFTAIGLYGAADSAPPQLVHMPTLKLCGEEMLDKYCPDGEATEEALPLSVVLKEASDKQTGQLALSWLCNRSQAHVDESEEPALVRFGRNAKVLPLHRQMHRLKIQQRAIERSIEKVDEEVQNHLKTAREHLAQKNKELAKRSMREKMVLEKRSAHLTKSLENLRMIEHQLRHSHSDAQVLNAYKLAADALKATHAESGLSEDSVASAVDDLEEVLETHDEMRSMVARPIGPDASADDAELEAELEDLLKLADEEPLPSLPDVPLTPPGAVSTTQLPRPGAFSQN